MILTTASRDTNREQWRKVIDIVSIHTYNYVINKDYISDMVLVIVQIRSGIKILKPWYGCVVFLIIKSVKI